MGRIKSALVKRVANKLMKEESFSTEFGGNKTILGNTMPSKRLRNILAGYITRLEKVKKAEK